jgi:hypothetical protein
MAYVNNIMIVRRDIMTKIARLLKEDQLEEKIDRIPLEISPKKRKSNRRCCIYKERADAGAWVAPRGGD